MTSEELAVHLYGPTIGSPYEFAGQSLCSVHDDPWTDADPCHPDFEPSDAALGVLPRTAMLTAALVGAGWLALSALTAFIFAGIIRLRERHKR